MSNNIHIKKAVLHILDTNVSYPVLSEKELDIDGVIVDFITNHIDKIQNDNNLKKANFYGENNDVKSDCELLLNNHDEFINVSCRLSSKLFGLMTKHPEIPNCDLIVCLYMLGSKTYLALLKMNYKSCYTHYVQQDNSGTLNNIIKYGTVLPSEGQKANEAVLIDLEDLSIFLIEKEIEIDAQKTVYFSKYFMGCDTNLSTNEKLKIIDNTAKKISKKYLDEGYETSAKIKQAISENIEEDSTLEIEKIANRIFGSNIDIRKEYIEEVYKAGIEEEKIEVEEKTIEKKFGRLKIKTDFGIEINMPSNLYNNRERVEFINNPDGTISILIKNAGKIISR